MKKTVCFITALILAFSLMLFGCGEEKNGLPDFSRNLTEMEFTKASLSATDKFGGELTPMGYKKADSERYVGLFYWMWISNSNYYYHDIYDCTKLMSTEEGQAAFWNIDPGNAEYQKLSRNGAFHFTNEPLYGYYNSSDSWVITRHMEMFIWADIDFIFLDTSNWCIYGDDYTASAVFDGTIKAPCYTLLDTMLDLYNKGWDVPKVVFLTNENSGDRVKEIRTAYYEYQNGKYNDLWFRPDGDKPMIIGTTSDNDGASDKWGTPSFTAVSGFDMEYFDVKETQWPNKANKPYGFPWICNRSPQYFHEESGAVSVSVAQHGNLGFTDMINRSYRGYDYKLDSGEPDDKSCLEENWQKGRNFENQWDTVFNLEASGKNVKFVNVTGWNEWIGAKFDNLGPKAVMVDNFYGGYTRDMEPDKTTYQDTTALQLTRNVRKFKYAPAAEKYSWNKKTINGIADFEGVKSVYLDMKGDAVNRDFFGFDVRKASKEEGKTGAWYSDLSARNDIVKTRVAHDDNNLYFLVETAEEIEEYTGGDNWMNILIKTDASIKESSFAGYDYIINRAPQGGKTSVQKSTGGWVWQNTGDADITVEGHKMFVTVPLSALGLNKDNVKFEFKVADNVVKPSWFNSEDAEHDIMHYYVTGDSAPIGRYNYSYGY